MTLPWWLDHFEPASLREVLTLFAGGHRFELSGRPARIAEALLRNSYASGAVDISRSHGSLSVRVESGLLLELGNALLRTLRASPLPPSAV
jgi:hypothetical protein